MPLKNYILNQEDREFTTSIGHWQGDCIWDPGPFFGHSGFLSLPGNFEGFSNECFLYYPYVKIPPDSGLSFLISYKNNPEIQPWGNAWVYLCDGINVVAPWAGAEGPPPPWINLSLVFITPPNWNMLSGYIWIRLNQVSPLPAFLYLDDISMPYISIQRPDHLPLMGVH